MTVQQIPQIRGRKDFNLLLGDIQTREVELTVEEPKGPAFHLCETSSNHVLKQVHFWVIVNHCLAG
jgi:hypothetical protein